MLDTKVSAKPTETLLECTQNPLFYTWTHAVARRRAKNSYATECLVRNQQTVKLGGSLPVVLPSLVFLTTSGGPQRIFTKRDADTATSQQSYRANQWARIRLGSNPASNSEGGVREGEELSRGEAVEAGWSVTCKWRPRALAPKQGNNRLFYDPCAGGKLIEPKLVDHTAMQVWKSGIKKGTLGLPKKGSEGHSECSSFCAGTGALGHRLTPQKHPKGQGLGYSTDPGTHCGQRSAFRLKGLRIYGKVQHDFFRGKGERNPLKLW